MLRYLCFILVLIAFPEWLPYDQLGAKTNRRESIYARQVPGEQAQVQVRYKLAAVLRVILTEGAFSELLKSLTDAAQGRMASEVDVSNDDLDQSIRQFHEIWRAKYHNNFDAADHQEVVFNYSLSESPDKRLVTIAIPPSSNLPQTQLKLFGGIGAGADWRLDVPASLTKAGLRAELLNHFAQLEEQKESWPAGETDGKRFVAHHLFAAVAASRL